MKHHSEHISKNDLIHLINQTDDKLSFVDKDYVYRAVNHAYLKTFNKRVDQIVGKSVWELTGETIFYNMIKPNIDKALNGELLSYEAWFDFPSSPRAYLIVRYAPSFDENDEVTGVIVTSTDITEHKRLEEEKEFYEKLTVHQSKMAQLGDMIGMISHQWRSPLHTLSTYLLQLRYNDDPATNKILDRCESLIEQLSDTIDDLHHFYDEASPKSSISLYKSAEHAISLLQYRIRSEKVQIHLAIPAECYFDYNNSHILHLLTIFIENALDALGQCIQNEKNITLIGECTFDHIIIDIIDNGDGISAALNQNPFDAGITTKSKVGHGYGLYFAHKIITEHLQGEVTLMEPKEGAHFKIKLPKFLNNS